MTTRPHSPREQSRLPSPRAAALGIAALACVVSLAALTGCYKRVVSASGPGAEHYRVYEPAQDDIVFGRWFGEGKQQEKKPSYKKP